MIARAFLFQNIIYRIKHIIITWKLYRNNIIVYLIMIITMRIALYGIGKKYIINRILYLTSVIKALLFIWFYHNVSDINAIP